MVSFKVCSNCGRSFNCGNTEPDNTCWCQNLSNIVPVPANGDCLCPNCLKTKIASMQNLPFTDEFNRLSHKLHNEGNK